MRASLVEINHGSYVISSDPGLVDVDVVSGYLAYESYWARGRSHELIIKSIENSALVVGAYLDDRQVGFARMVTDLATFAWLADVFVLTNHRGTGLGAALVKTIVEHPDVVGVKRQFLATADAHDLYRRFGYQDLERPDRIMLREAATP